jgi:hypothetical protein
MNIHQDNAGLDALMKAAEQQDKDKNVQPQNCNLDDEECLTCGS